VLQIEEVEMRQFKLAHGDSSTVAAEVGGAGHTVNPVVRTSQELVPGPECDDFGTSDRLSRIRDHDLASHLRFSNGVSLEVPPSPALHQPNNSRTHDFIGRRLPSNNVDGDGSELLRQ
jgi:hypothetical protein